VLLNNEVYCCKAYIFRYHSVRKLLDTLSYNILFGKPEEMKPLESLSRRWDNIRMDLRDIGWEVLE
jgi:hypothetical protein